MDEMESLDRSSVRMPVQLKSQLYRTVIRPAALYGSECWPCTRNEERKLSVMETRMLRWTLGVTLKDHICNDTIRARMKVAPIAQKMQEKRLRWYGHVRRRDESHITKLALAAGAPGNGPEVDPR